MEKFGKNGNFGLWSHGAMDFLGVETLTSSVWRPLICTKTGQICPAIQIQNYYHYSFL